VFDGWNETPAIAALWAVSWLSNLPSAAFHRNSFWSSVPAAAIWLFGLRATALTVAAAPVKARTCWPLAKVESRAGLSALPVKIWWASVERAREVTVSPWAAASERDGAGGSVQNLSRPSLPAVKAALLAGLIVTALTGPTCAPKAATDWPLAGFQKRTVRS